MNNKFGTVDTEIWHHPDFKELDDDAKLLFLYFKTCDHMNMIGCFYCPYGYIEEDTGWSKSKIQKTVSKLLPNGFVMVDEQLKYVFLPKHLDKLPFKNPNQGVGAQRLFESIPKRFIHINELATTLLRQEKISEQFRNSLETLKNSVSNTVTVTTTETVTETVTTPKGVDAQKTALDGVEGFDVQTTFDEFWLLWPKRGDSKKPAFDKFKSKCKSMTTFSKIMDGLKLQIPQFERKENKFIPAASTWLNQERWNNDPEPPMGGGGGGGFDSNNYGDTQGDLE